MEIITIYSFLLNLQPGEASVYCDLSTYYLSDWRIVKEAKTMTPKVGVPGAACALLAMILTSFFNHKL
jgi:hypothetical protein